MIKNKHSFDQQLNKDFIVKVSLGIIVAAAFFIRIFNLGGQDMASDDVLYSFRSIGLVDYVASLNFQSTPMSWFSERQWWQSLSFHDHPPLVFIIQWIFFKIGGINVWAARMPFALAGALSVLFLFFLGRELFSARIGLFSAAALAVANYAVWISRIGLLDGFLVLWIILSLYFFVKAETKPINYLWWGIFCAAGILTKYTFIFMFPVFIAMLFFRRKTVFKEKWFYIGIIAFFILISPIIIYNIMMWQTRGHLDSTLSSMIGKIPEDFEGLARSSDRNMDILSALKEIFYDNFSIGFIILFFSGTILFIYGLFKDKIIKDKYLIILFGLLFALAMLIFGGIGGGRFGVIVLPFTALIIGYLASSAIEWFDLGSKKKAVISILLLFGIWEVFYAIQSQLVVKPLINNRLLLSANLPSYGGYNQLEKYISDFYKDQKARPVINFYVEVPQLARYQEKIIGEISKDRAQLAPYEHLLVYSDRLAWFPMVWITERRILYEAIPIISLSRFIGMLQMKGIEYYKKFGLKDITIIVPTDNIKQNQLISDEEGVDDFVSQLEAGLEPDTEISGGADGKALFKVFSFPFP